MRSTPFFIAIFCHRAKIHFSLSISIWFSIKTDISRHPMFRKDAISIHPWWCPHFCLRAAVHVQAHGCVLFETDTLAKRSLWRFLYSDVSTSDPLSKLYGHKICFWLVSWPKSAPKFRFCSRSSWVIRSCLVRSSCSFSYPQHLFQCAGNVNYTFSRCESASVQLRSADCIGVVSWGTTSTKVASYRHSAPLRQGALKIDTAHLVDTGHWI